MSTTPRAAPSGPLAGVRVLDLTQALAGPYCTMLLADLGADVVKIEPPTGDMTRFGGPFTREDTARAYGGYFASLNRGKRSIALDLKDVQHREAFLGLVEAADALVENSRPGVMERLELSYERLHERNPRLVYAAIRGFGDPRTGASPYTDRPAFDIIAQAMGGLVAMTGTEDGEMLRCGPSVGDIFPAALTAVGLLSALHHATVTGQGQFVDVGMYDAITSLCEAAVYRYSYMGAVDRPRGNAHPALCPFDVFPTADGACAIAAPTDSHWPLLCDLIGRPDLAADEDLARNNQRVRDADRVRAEITAWTRERTSDEVVATLAGRVPVGPVNDAAALFADPHLAARDMLVELEQPDGSRPVTVAGSAIKTTATPSGVSGRPPWLGEHTEEVLAEAGIDPSLLDRSAT